MKEAPGLRSSGESAASGAGVCRFLAELAPGESIRLCDHAGAPFGRLADLGMVPGTRVQLVRRAPLGDPLEVELRGFRLCVRAADIAGVCGEPGALPARRDA